MPFTIDGTWIPTEPPKEPTKSQKPVKVRLVKRKQSLITVILNLSHPAKELQDLASTLKKKLGCGGAVKEGNIEIQGDKVAEVLRALNELKIKAS